MEQFAEYGHAIVSVAAFALIGLILSPISAARKANEQMEPGAMPKEDYSNLTYRMCRAHQNAVEMAGLFTAVTIAAILAGASPFWVNLLAALFLVSRIIMAFVHIRGIGKPQQGPRTLLYVLGWACCVILAILAIFAVF
ncbi:MAG: MAPEG family protein [Paracoccaceae bacterium]